MFPTHLGVERRALRRAVGEQLVPEGVESRLGVRDRPPPARTRAEGVLEPQVRGILSARSGLERYTAR